VVSSAVRLHGHMMHVGQAVGTAAWLCLRDATQPRDLARDWARVRELQTRLVRSAGGPGVLLWPFHDLAPDDLRFEAANQLAVRGIWQADPNSLDFNAWQNVTRRELARTLYRLKLSLATTPAAPATDIVPRYRDLPVADVDRVAIEGLIALGEFGPQQELFQPQGEVDWASSTAGSPR